jgi:hypothetical protein
MGVKVNVGAVKMKSAAVCTGAGFKLAVAAAVTVVVVGAVKIKLAAVCMGGGFKLAAAEAAAGVVIGAAKIKLVAVCTGADFKFAATAAAAAAVVFVVVVAVVIVIVVVVIVVATVLERKLNTGFVAGTLAGYFTPAPNPKFGGLLTDELVPTDDRATGPVPKLTDNAVP